MVDRPTGEPYSQAIELDSEELVAKLELELPEAPPSGKRFRVTVEEIDNAYEARFRRRVSAGLRDSRAGRLVPQLDVVAWIGSWGTKNERPMPTGRRRRVKSSGPKRR